MATLVTSALLAAGSRRRLVSTAAGALLPVGTAAIVRDPPQDLDVIAKLLGRVYRLI